MVAPVHRPWGNRVIRESLILSKNGYSVSALMKAGLNQNLNGIEIIPVPSPENRMSRVFGFVRIFWMAYKLDADIYHLHNPDTIPVALLLKICGNRVIYDTHEDFSRRLLMRSWIPLKLRGLMCWFVTALEKATSKYVDAMFVTQPQQLQTFSKKTYLLRNALYLDSEILTTVNFYANEINPDKKIFRLIYVGGISRERGISTMLDALTAVNKQIDCRLWLAGEDMTGIIDEAKKNPGWRYVDYLGLIPQEQAFAYMSKSDIGLVVINDIGDHATARPSKIYEYMGFGLPFIASDFKDWREFINVDAGWWIAPANPSLLAKTILYISKNATVRGDKGNQGKEYLKKFNWKTESCVLLEVYKQKLAA